jgi:hypothetical protein
MEIEGTVASNAPQALSCKQGGPIMKYGSALIAAASFFTIGAGATTTYVNDDEGMPHNLVASMKAVVESPPVVVLALNEDEGVPHNLVTR